jgi:cytochrome P450
VMTLLFAGHDTTTATVAFLFRELALRPDVAGAIAGELDGTLGYERLMGGSLDRRGPIQAGGYIRSVSSSTMSS